MKSNFFKMLADCERKILVEDWFLDVDGKYRSYSSETKNAVQELVNHIEFGSVFHAKVPVFLCKNWRMRPKELTKQWESETGKRKREDTFRSQVSEASMRLYSIFGEDIFENLMLDDEETAKNVIGTISILKFGGNGFSGLESAQVVSYLSGHGTVKKFELGECGYEVKLLRKYCKRMVQRDLEKADMEKLCYLKSVLDQPLLDKDTKCMNVEKSELLKKIGGMK